MGSDTPRFELTRTERLALKRLVRRGFDLIIDQRHWQCLCYIGRKVRKTPTDVLYGIMEKVFVQDLKMITAIDDLIDRPLKYLRTHLHRLRHQPKKRRRLLRKRGEEILLLAELFPNEFAKRANHGREFVTELRRELGIDFEPEPRPVEIDRALSVRIADLTQRLARKTTDNPVTDC